MRGHSSRSTTNKHIDHRTPLELRVKPPGVRHYLSRSAVSPAVAEVEVIT